MRTATLILLAYLSFIFAPSLAAERPQRTVTSDEVGAVLLATVRASIIYKDSGQRTELKGLETAINRACILIFSFKLIDLVLVSDGKKAIPLIDIKRRLAQVNLETIENEIQECSVNAEVKKGIAAAIVNTTLATLASPSKTRSVFIDMDDLRLDMASLGGQKVRVMGVGNYMLDMFMLKKSMTDMSPIIIDTSKLQREQRRQIIQRCGDIMSGCRVIVIGTVGKVSYQNGIVAENIEWFN